MHCTARALAVVGRRRGRAGLEYLGGGHVVGFAGVLVERGLGGEGLTAEVAAQAAGLAAPVRGDRDQVRRVPVVVELLPRRELRLAPRAAEVAGRFHPVPPWASACASRRRARGARKSPPARAETPGGATRGRVGAGAGASGRRSALRSASPP